MPPLQYSKNYAEIGTLMCHFERQVASLFQIKLYKLPTIIVQFTFLETGPIPPIS